MKTLVNASPDYAYILSRTKMILMVLDRQLKRRGASIVAVEMVGELAVAEQIILPTVSIGSNASPRPVVDYYDAF